MSLDLSIVVPVYNALDIAEDSVNRLIKVLDHLGISYEILIRDDGSTDASYEVLSEIAQRNSRVKFSSNRSNRGLGYTLVKLFQEARGSNIIYCDCDLPFGENIISLLLERIKRHDIVVASRYQGMPNDVPWTRKIASRLYFLFCKLLFNIPVVDIGSGSVAIRKKALDRLNLKVMGFGIHAELFVEAVNKGLLIQEVPAQSYQANKGSFRIWKHGLQTLFETIILWLRKF